MFGEGRLRPLEARTQRTCKRGVVRLCKKSARPTPCRRASRQAALPLKRGRISHAFDGVYSPPPEGETASEASGGGRFSTFCAKRSLLSQRKDRDPITAHRTE